MRYLSTCLFQTEWPPSSPLLIPAFPGKKQELDRLDLMHELIKDGIGEKLYLAPLDKKRLHRVLDVGTGTGTWATEMGELFPAAEVRGCDLSPVQPSWYVIQRI